MSSHTYFHPEGKIEQVKIALNSADLYEAALNLLSLFKVKAQHRCLSQIPIIVHKVLQGRDSPFLLLKSMSDL